MHPADKYCNNVLNNKIIACKWVKLCCQRYVDDLEIGHKRGLYFDKESAQYAIDFFQFLHHSKGEWAGQVFELSDWQQFITWNLFGWVREKDGFRRFRTAYLSVARKAGKTTWLVPGLKEKIDLCQPTIPCPEDFIVLASDVSHIDVDRHHSTRCFLINIGLVHLQYGQNPEAGNH